MKIEIEESAIDTLRDMVQKLQDERDSVLSVLERANKLLAELTFSDWIQEKDDPSKDIRQRIKALHVIAWETIAKHTTEPKVMA